MNYRSAMDPTPEERFIDAALREQSCLGADGNDDELVSSILSKTVLQASVNEAPASPVSPTATPRLWLATGIAAAALVALLILGLNSLPYDSNSEIGAEMQFSVRLLPPEEIVESTDEPQDPPLIAANHHRNTISPNHLSASAASDLSAPDTLLEITTSFGPSFSTFPEQLVRRELFRIASAEENSNGNHHTYSGNVRMQHEDFLIEANTVEVSTHTDPRSEAPYLVAHDITLTQFQPARRVVAGKMTFDSVDSAFVLTEVRKLSTAEGDLERFHQDDRIILTATSLAIDNSHVQQEEKEVTYANPLPRIPK